MASATGAISTAVAVFEMSEQRCDPEQSGENQSR
jgi:hypothetical protein